MYVSHTYTHTRLTALSGTTRVSWYQKGKTNLDFTEARDSEWQWHQLGYMQVCTSLQSDNHASTPPLSFFTGRMPFLRPNQQRQSTEGSELHLVSHSVTETEQCCIFFGFSFIYCVLSIFCLYKVRGCVVNLVGHGSVFVWVSGSCDPLFTLVASTYCGTVK